MTEALALIARIADELPSDCIRVADKIYAAIRSAIERGMHVSFLTETSKENGGSFCRACH